MTAPRLVSCAFASVGEAGRYARMARVLAFTARRHCPGWEICIDDRPPVPMASPIGVGSHVFNTQKMAHWHRAVMDAPDGAQLLLIDVDTVIVRPLDDIWVRPFDLAYTTKVHTFPFNSGVVFVRVSDRLRAFVQAWHDINVDMLAHRDGALEWRRRFGGINQAALGRALESDAARAIAILELPCVEWNCEDSAWKAFDPAVTRIVHYKSALRRCTFGVAGVMVGRDRGLQQLVHLWHALEREANDTPTRRAR